MRVTHLRQRVTISRIRSCFTQFFLVVATVRGGEDRTRDPSPYQSNACAIPPAESSFTEQSKQTKTSKRFGNSQRERRVGWASWAIHGSFKKLTDCGDAS